MPPLDSDHALTALAATLVCGALAMVMPVLVARVPEPVSSAGSAEPHTKETYAEIATTPGLGIKMAAAAGAVGALVGWRFGPVGALLPWCVLIPVGVALAVIDWRTTLLPTRIIAPTYVAVVGLTLAAWLIDGDDGDLVRAGIGWAIAGTFYLLLWLIHPRGMGYGDVRLSGVLGIALGYLGYAELVVGLYSSFLVGGVVGVVLSLLHRVDRTRFPFGPFMLVGALIGAALGAPLATALGY